MPSGSDTFDDLNDDESLTHEETSSYVYEKTTTSKKMKDDTKECFLEDEQEPENLMEGEKTIYFALFFL